MYVCICIYILCTKTCTCIHQYTCIQICTYILVYTEHMNLCKHALAGDSGIVCDVL